ncbi:MAG: VanW family protein [Candidatus Magasanikbacteria bacterium]|nr:VanW family protein [Candidatus Magasanikbacteria bacterium]
MPKDFQEQVKQIIPIQEKKRWPQKLMIGAGIFLFVIVILFSGSWAYARLYKGRIYPGVYLGSHHFGGLTRQEAKDFIENFNNRMVKENLDFNFSKDNGAQNFKLSVVSVDDSSVEMVRVDSDSSADKLMAAGRSNNFFTNVLRPIRILFSKFKGKADVAIEDRFISSLEDYLTPFSDMPRNANVKITDLSALAYSVEKEKSGYVFDYEELRSRLQDQIFMLSLAPLTVNKKQFNPDVFEPDLAPLIPKLGEIFNYGDLGLNYTDPQTGAKRDWSIGPTIYSQWLEARRENGEPVFALNREKVKSYLETLRPDIDVPAKDAKFVMENDKVKEFQAHQSGISLNEEKTYHDLDAIFRERNYRPAELAKTITVSTDIVEPNILISNLNDLGIMEIVGVGLSTFRDSHTNRIKNIANAVKRLNGTLIKPDEEFSANKYAGPYTTANGFLPEQVIKGNKITPEVGGGMCQIGTTLFRGAMNSGMPITERRNHSLVVGYYADPVNGNPGTDATLYEPSVDFKFKNDTGNYLLLQTSIDYKKQELVFTFWGKSDGRKGSYTHPKVSKWIPVGEPQEVVVTTLKPGERKCQNAFRGAVASFTYTVINPAGEKIERVFDSYYRPLSQICMVGAPLATTTPAADAPLEVSDSI